MGIVDLLSLSTQHFNYVACNTGISDTGYKNLRKFQLVPAVFQHVPTTADPQFPVDIYCHI